MSFLDPVSETEQEHRKQQNSHYLLYSSVYINITLQSYKKDVTDWKGKPNKTKPNLKEKTKTCTTPDQEENG